jgi:hypothetical protein
LGGVLKSSPRFPAWPNRAKARLSLSRREPIDQTRRAEDLLTPRGGRAVSNVASRRDPNLPLRQSRQVVFQQVKLRAPRPGVVAEELASSSGLGSRCRIRSL